GFGLVAGYLELGLVLTQRTLDPRISMASLRTNRHFLWMIPISDELLFAAVGLLVVLLARFGPSRARWLFWRLFSGMAVLALLMTVEGLSPVASLALSGGFGVWLGPSVGKLVERHGRPLRMGVAGLALGLALLTGLNFAWVITAETRARSG